MMTEPLNDDEIQAIVDYARQRFAEERWPLSPTLRPVREALAKLDPPRGGEPAPART
jgi:hypothetical protein